MPIRIPAARLQAACSRPLPAILNRALLGTVPPRTATRTRIREQVQLSAQSLIVRNKMSTKAGFSPATSTTAAISGSSTSSPAPASSTPPRPGSSPSAAAASASVATAAAAGASTTAAAAAAGAGANSGGAAPAPPSQHSEETEHQQPQPTVTNTTTRNNGAIATSPDTTTDADTSAAPALPALPEPEQGTTTTIHVNGQAVALDSLGPMVVNRDGTVSRIGNWHELSGIERQNTLRILGRRNQLRLGNLRAGRPADGGEGEGV
ncbi:hypothetical protein F5144DRAFT_661359 [Chaetomium tenue]|uniref:Uncharacterized protein n=1 Tax=Chaetomium tenue TaxID=1854479 RepID=A0ACB7NU31_9PEZI|nr:hypothetical protein F5144DRAFT_661359 [Chaetomium globosum]